MGLELAWEPPTGYDELREEEVVRVLLGLEGVRPKIDRRLMAAWMTEVGLANYDERSLNTLIHRLRRSGRLRVPQRKKHTRVE